LEAEVFFGKRSPFLGTDKFDVEIKELAQDVYTHALSVDTPAYLTMPEPAQSLKQLLILDMLKRSFARLPYLAFPLLERLVKRSCKDYVAPNGEVRKKWKARGGKEYKQAKPGKNPLFCSSLEDLLGLFGVVKGVDAENDFTTVLNVFAQAEKVQDGYEALYRWRCKSLHGEESHFTIAGILLSLISVVCLHEAGPDRYGDLRLRAEYEARNEKFAPERPGGHRFGLSFYPPT
jgi:hypothetical protein